MKILPLALTILRQAGGTTLPVCGFTTFDATLNNVSTSIRAIVVSKLHKNLLISWQDLISFWVINENFPAQLQEVHSVQKDKFDSTRAREIDKFRETLSDDLNPKPMEIPGKSMQPNAVPTHNFHCPSRTSPHATHCNTGHLRPPKEAIHYQGQ